MTARAAIPRAASLAAFNSFGVPVVADCLWHIRKPEDLPAFRAAASSTPPLLLGGGTNVLFVAERLARPVLRIELLGRRILEDEGEQVLVEAAAGENWHGFVRWSLTQGLSGLENLSLIPGSVGAAPVQNIGAYGVELERLCEAVEIFDLASGQFRWLSPGECAFGYRDSVFKHAVADQFIITRVRFRLSRRFEPVLDYGELKAELATRGIRQPTALEVSEAVCAIRRRKLPDPAVLGNAGSFFKNPIVPKSLAEALLARHPDCPHYPAPAGQVKLAAGWLIERAGWKGYRRGAAGVHDRHALVLVNHGGATGEAIWRLACDIRDDVARKFGVLLEPEPRIIFEP
ncbi:MAG: UDP-N-acetylmuramate dehydrogenase [Casimicrobiaceae bacterium]|nr:UDP-N-acetylmuramate dehydrogenase [Casimicrobiaceae bacterium]MDW8311959.1 UDP-N-acetylmuramate dehydrogenase [Burkholderiales bacterium]